MSVNGTAGLYSPGLGLGSGGEDERKTEYPWTARRDLAGRIKDKIQPRLAPGWDGSVLDIIELMLAFADEYERMKGGRHHPPSADDPDAG